MVDQFVADVAIAGAGPVGLGLAIDLAQQGKSVVLLEKTRQLHRIPKGQSLTQRTGEHFRRWGISQAVRQASPIPPEFGNAGVITYGNLLGEYHHDWFQRSKVRPYYFADNERLPQYLLEDVMRQRAREFANIELITGASVTGVTQDDSHATLRCEATPESAGVEVQASYVVGCDGARSVVRELAGIKQDTDHQGPRMALLVFRSKALDGLLARFPGKTIFNVMDPALQGYWQFLGRVDLEGGWFYHAPVPDDATRDNFDFAAYLHKVVGAPFDIDFEHIGFWDLRISMAQSYQNGRVFIAGDAAHSHPPYGGYGVNTGFEDATNLSWKLGACLDGWGSATLLSSYTAERLPVFKSVSQDFIGRMIADFDGFCSQFNPEQDKQAFEQAWQQRASADDVDVTEFLPNYAGSPLVLGQANAQSGAKGMHSVRAQAGYHLAPQPLPDGSDLWDQVGGAFVLLELTDSPDQAQQFTAAAQALGVPFRVVRHASTELQQAYGAPRLLVRPDLFVAWVGDKAPSGAQHVLAQAIGAA